MNAPFRPFEPVADSPVPGQAHPGRLLITWVWALEISGAGIGFANALYTTFGDTLPDTLAQLVPAAPMLMLPVAELGRVPLTSVIYHKKPVARVLALTGALLLTYPAVENWTIGFDRIAQMRIRAVSTAENDLAKAKANESAFASESQEASRRNEHKRAELRGSITLFDQNIADINTQQKAAAVAHQNTLGQIRDACRIVRESCIVPRSRSEDQRYAGEVGELRDPLAVAQKQRQESLRKIDQLVNDDAMAAARLASETRNLAAAVSEAEQRAREAENDNVIYRLASHFFGVKIADLTPAQIGTARWVFATFAAMVVASMGTLGALVHYAGNREPGAPSFIGRQVTKLLRARRKYIARKRKVLVVPDEGVAHLVRIARAINR